MGHFTTLTPHIYAIYAHTHARTRSHVRGGNRHGCEKQWWSWKDIGKVCGTDYWKSREQEGFVGRLERLERVGIIITLLWHYTHDEHQITLGSVNFGHSALTRQQQQQKSSYHHDAELTRQHGADVQKSLEWLEISVTALYSCMGGRCAENNVFLTQNKLLSHNCSDLLHLLYNAKKVQIYKTE